MKLSKQQIGLMEHTISGPNRNWFATNKETSDSKIFKVLVEQGLATSEKPPEWIGDDVIYRLTKKGKEALNETQNINH